uniref:Large ribosomal subunit protein mL64 n=1 Tax=Parascaris univalens TaxID=6257 RepID=A0A915B1M4_PARUN
MLRLQAATSFGVQRLSAELNSPFVSCAYSTEGADSAAVKTGVGHPSSTDLGSSSDVSTRNISRLRARHLALAEGRIAPVSYEWEKERWAKRERFGRYGLASGVSLAELWPTVEEIEEENAMGLYVRYSDALKSSQAADQKAKAAIVARLQKLAKNEANYADVLAKFEASNVKAEKEKSEKEEKLERRIREIQEYFGYWIDPKDPRFEVMLAQKEAEEKKAEKLARRQAAEKKRIAAVTASAETDK